MFNCKNCKNKNGCNYISSANQIKYEVKQIEKRYKNFYGCILVYCEYFIQEQEEKDTTSMS